jgi:HK97 family phage prohead protease
MSFGTKAVTTQPDGTQQAEFRYDFFLDQKAYEVTEDENGDIWVEGYASDWGVDRQEEAFEPGAFERGLKSFLSVNPIMLYHHQYDKALGVFTDAKVDEHGLWVRGRVDRPAAGSWAEDIFNKIKRGTIKAFSVGGIFKRRMTKSGPRIYDVDLGEISVTPFPVNPRTTFAVVAGKAFESAPVLEGKSEDDEAPAVEVVDDSVVEPEVEEIPETETPVPEETPDEPEVDEPEVDEPAVSAVEPGSITAEHIANGSINTEHLSDELRSRFSELKETVGMSPEEVAARVDALVGKLGQVIEHVGLKEVHDNTEGGADGVHVY